MTVWMQVFVLQLQRILRTPEEMQFLQLDQNFMVFLVIVNLRKLWAQHPCAKYQKDHKLVMKMMKLKP